ncbi:MAG TPA: Asp-tRNA(Asn)/Glu-tRNA(Gln) amidotransferase subunit GatA [Chitinispirillaceae bacterium]|nr:Asp-tRNA(Asn)/Glu-tRNA(Gln) amidotransferase subunit GatA [Chitinispirillaceae bacterium]
MVNTGSTITETVMKTRCGQIRVEALVSQFLDRIQKEDPTINSFISVLTDEALKRAKQLDSLTENSRKEMPLFGIPIAIKDNICTAGIKTTCASKMLDSFIPPYNASVVDMLKNAGAVIIGKTNMDEFAMGSSTETSRFGITRNPKGKERIPGGSSGGSAAAVSADLVPAALGSDTGGSIRQPCSHCGVTGLKPTYGRVSRYGLIAFASSLDQIGPIATDVRDIGLLLETISQEDKHDSTCAGKQFINNPDIYNKDIRGMKIGLPEEYFGEGLSDQVRNALMELVKKLEEAGAITVTITLPNVQYAIAAYYIICTAEASSNLARYDGVKYGYRAPECDSLIDMYTETRSRGFGDEVKRRIMLGTYVLSSGYYDAYYLKAAKIRTLIANDFKNAFKECDVIFSPVAPTAAFKLGEKTDDPLKMYLTDIYTVSANLTGIPGISIPCKTSDLPIGAQLMAPSWKEDTLLKAAFAAQTLSES